MRHKFSHRQSSKLLLALRYVSLTILKRCTDDTVAWLRHRVSLCQDILTTIYFNDKSTRAAYGIAMIPSILNFSTVYIV
jgi:hypothetical protein